MSVCLLHLLAVASFVALSAPAWAKPRLTPDQINTASFAPLPDPPAKTSNPFVFKAEVLLDRARFSPGAFDGIDGDNFRKAVAAYAHANALSSTTLDQAAWDKLSADRAPVLARYKITKADVKGPYTKRIAAKFEAQSHLKRLNYRTIKEMLAERFHLSTAALMALNPHERFEAGDEINVPNLVVDHGNQKAARVLVDKGGHDVQAFDATGKLLAFYPASIGSTEKPAPTGDYTIRRIVHNPDYTYDPAYGFKGVKAKKPFRIAPGPNNPVGAVWMDLSFEGYGIHGTPDPEAIGKTQSHGCIRMTNWDALDLASMVDKDTPVSFQDRP